jgi:glycosyltransferase involved in cell wall biosynthesis
MVSISAVIITFNEEKNIGRCLDALLPVADDVVVVDSFSKDATEQICLEKGVRFVKHAFEGHIEQKNWAITQAKFPHVLSLDADEVLTPVLQQSILEVKQNWQKDGYSVRRLNNYCGHWVRHCGWYPDKKLRLWDSRKGQWAGTNPHDRFEMDKGCQTADLKGDMLHYSFHSIRQHMDQVNLFSDIKARMAFEKGKKAGYLKILFKPIFRFLKCYVLKAGFLDGFYGLVISMNSAHGEFLRYVKLKRLWQMKRAAQGQR